MLLLSTKFRTQDLALLYLIELVPAHQPSLFRLLYRTFLPSSKSTLPPNLVSTVNLLRVHSIPFSRSLIKVLKRTDPSNEPRGMPAMAGHPIYPHSQGTTIQPVFYSVHMNSTLIAEKDHLKSDTKLLVSLRPCSGWAALPPRSIALDCCRRVNSTIMVSPLFTVSFCPVHNKSL